jgi:hypothetical protein
MDILGMGLLAALGFIIIMFKIGMNKFVRLGWFGDLVISTLIAALFFGTMGGMMIGLTAGIIVSLFLGIAKFFSKISIAEG